MPTVAVLGGNGGKAMNELKITIHNQDWSWAIQDAITKAGFVLTGASSGSSSRELWFKIPDRLPLAPSKIATNTPWADSENN